MKRFRSYVTVALATIAASSVSFAQTASWSMKSKDGNLQVIVPAKIYVSNFNGQKRIIDIQNDKTLATGLDSVTPVVNGYALGLRLAPIKASGGLSFSGLIKKGTKLIGKDTEGATMMYSLVGIYDAATEQYRDINYGSDDPLFINKYSFFSEGLIPVTRDGVKYGYADTSGNIYLKIGYKGVKPFSNGFAVVNDKEFIDRSGRKLKLAKEASKIKEAYSFDANGQALVGGDNEWMTIDNRGNRIERVNPYIGGRIPENIMGAWNPNGDHDPITTIADDGNSNPDIVIFQAGNLFGYKRNGRVVVPAQFSVAQPFINGVAYVEIPNGDSGFITLNGSSPLVSMKKGSTADESGMITYEVTVKAPEGSLGSNCKLIMSDSENKLYALTASPKQAGNLVFKMKAPKGSTPNKLESDGLTIWNSGMSKVVTAGSAEDKLKISIACNGQANEKGNVPVSVTVTNPTDEEISTTVQVSGKNLSASKAVTLAPGESATIYAQFTKVVFKEKRAVNVTAGKAKASRSVELTPNVQL